jgi:ATP-dependent Clp protease ATP-binding subunit ClpC
VRLWDPASGAELRRCTGHENSVLSVAWSADGRWLASGSADGTVRLWDPASGTLRESCTGHTGWVQNVAWSADGRWLASGSKDGTVRLWDPASGAERRRCTGHEDRVLSVAWSTDGRWLASGSADGTVRLWDPANGQEHQRFTFPDKEAYAWRLTWSPDGAFLVSTHNYNTIRFWDTRHLVEQAPVLATTTPRSLPQELATLPGVLATLHRLNIHPPLSLLHDLRELLGGLPVGDELNRLSAHPGFRQLIQLRWPGAARTGLIALLLRQLPTGDWQRPAELGPGDLIPALTQALSGEAIEPQAPPPPIALLTQAADTLDNRLLTLLSALGPQAVAADPGLPLRLLPQIPTLPPLAERQRRLLGQTLTPLHAGPTQGSGLGHDRTGIAPTGPITALVPSQLAYPWDLLAWRCENGGLLYRTRTGKEPPHYRPTVIVLDISPPCFGPIEALTRPAAHALATTLRQHQIPVVLLAAGGQATVHLLDQPADLLQLFTRRTRQPVHTADTLAQAQALCRTLQGHDRTPLILLLTHPWWGVDAPHLPAPPHLRALFVQYPGKPVHPVWAERCERWETIGPEQGDRLAVVMGRLIG